VRRASGPAPRPHDARGALTDGRGRYEIPNLPAGTYYLVAMKTGYVTLPAPTASDRER
jgi:hypothetical protein